MIFYRAVDSDGLVHWETRADFAKKIDPNYAEHDVGNQKGDLHALLNDSEKAMHELRQEIARLRSEPVTSGSEEIDVGALRTVLQEDATHAVAKEEFSASVQTNCPKCSFDRKRAERWAEAQISSLTADNLGVYISSLSGWLLGTAAQAVASRFNELARTVERESSNAPESTQL